MSPLIVRVTLLSGRYHAHLWGEAQHAMGGPEWPPSPWRVLRAIAASWFNSAGPPCTPAQRDAILTALGRAAAPVIWLPKASFEEIPFYQPVTKDVVRSVGGKRISLREINSRVLHFDHFVVVAVPNVYFVFEVDFTEEQRSALSVLLARIHYFGRAESRALLCLAGSDFQKPDDYYEAKSSGGQVGSRNAVHRQVLVLTADFRAEDLWQIRAADSNVLPDFPPHLVETLIAAKKPLPESTKWVHYDIPREAIVPGLPRVKRPQPRTTMRSAAEVVIGLFRRVPIPVADTVLIAREFRDQAVRAYQRVTGRNSVMLSGREDDGTIAKGHEHAYYLPQPNASTGFIERLVVKLPGGEDGVEEDLLDALFRVTHLLRRDTYPILAAPLEVRSNYIVQIASHWRSLTPYLPPLRYKRDREENTADQQLLRSLQAGRSSILDGPLPIRTRVVPVLSHLYSSRIIGWRRYRFLRRAGVCFDLQFRDPIALPPAIGVDAHFGLGQFTPSN